jgi:L-ascorbate metabolism protein UlaG (beta-lactamase superfamily)
VEITWLGHSCFRIKGRGVTVITDPYPKEVGYSLGKPVADIVTLSHPHPGHSYVGSIGGAPKVVAGPGEYEIAGILISGIPTFHDSERGNRRGKNTVYLMEVDEVMVCHLGDVGHVPSQGQVEEMSGVEVLLVPVGGVSTLNAIAAAEAVRLLNPRIVIPMHFKTAAVTCELESVDGFLKEMGVKDTAPRPKLTVSKSGLPSGTQVVVLDYPR